MSARTSCVSELPQFVKQFKLLPHLLFSKKKKGINKRLLKFVLVVVDYIKYALGIVQNWLPLNLYVYKHNS